MQSTYICPTHLFFFVMPVPAHNFSYEEFHAFVMLYAANADGHITSKEENLISPTLNAEHYAEVKQIFNDCDDNEALALIFSYQNKYLASKADRDKILADMVLIYEAEAGFQHIERGVHKLFERMMNSL